MRISKIIAAAAAVALMVSCSHKAAIQGNVDGLASGKVEIALLNGGSYNVLDSVKVNGKGAFKYRIPVEEGQPEFVYCLYNGRKIASLILVDDRTVNVKTDTLGHFTVENSPESEQLRQVEESFGEFMASMRALVSEDDPSQAKMTRLYIDYYRDRVKYIINNPKSLTVIPVLYQKINEFSPIFAQTTDALHFRAATDSLKTVYPDSRYVQALEKETVRRETMMALEQKLANAPEQGFLDISAPDINGTPVSLGSVKSKVIMVYFWNPLDNAQKMFNIESILPIYEEFHDKGFEIYGVALTPDKVDWAAAVRGQKLPWINVCDGLGANSPIVATYNVQVTPQAALIQDGNLVSVEVSGEAGLRKELQRMLN
ncbi:MAG: AhpC/TSA family protein [Bacteroidales bacterium]|nr:AhpC/TSA family protein [Bacteroidales bacterium]